MFAVMFEVTPRKERWNDYLDLAKQLRPKLEAIDGFIANERFGSKSTEGLVLSLSIWRDEKSVIRWRTEGEHHGVQQQGRSAVFADYHLRVGEIVSDTDPPRGTSIEQQRFDETEIGEAKLCTITEVAPGRTEPTAVLDYLRLDRANSGLTGQEIFESITEPGKLLVLASWRDKTAASEWNPAAIDPEGGIRHRQIRVIRDYGMFDRREAPQFYPNATRP